MEQITLLHSEILKTLRENNSSYASPITSKEIGRLLHVTPSYIREQMKLLQMRGWIRVRKGPGGGYFLRPKNEEETNDLL